MLQIINENTIKNKNQENKCFNSLKQKLNWSVKCTPIFSQLTTKDGDVACYTPLEDFTAITKKDDPHKVFGITTKKYHPVQNSTILEMLSDLKNNHNLSLKDYHISDKKIVTNFSTNNQIQVSGDPSPIELGLACAWGHGGLSGISFLPYLGRLHCLNGISTLGNFKSFSLKHTKGIVENLPKTVHYIAANLEKMREALKGAEKLFNEFSSKNLNSNTSNDHERNKAVNLLLHELFSPNRETIRDDDAFHNKITFVQQKIDEYSTLFGKESIWAFYNAFTDLISNYGRNPKEENSAQIRLKQHNPVTKRKLDTIHKFCIKLAS